MYIWAFISTIRVSSKNITSNISLITKSKSISLNWKAFRWLHETSENQISLSFVPKIFPLNEICFRGFKNDSYESSSDLDDHRMILWSWMTSNLDLSLPIQLRQWVPTVKIEFVWTQHIWHRLQLNDQNS